MALIAYLYYCNNTFEQLRHEVLRQSPLKYQWNPLLTVVHRLDYMYSFLHTRQLLIHWDKLHLVSHAYYQKHTLELLPLIHRRQQRMDTVPNLHQYWILVYYL